MRLTFDHPIPWRSRHPVAQKARPPRRALQNGVKRKGRRVAGLVAYRQDQVAFQIGSPDSLAIETPRCAKSSASASRASKWSEKERSASSRASCLSPGSSCFSDRITRFLGDRDTPLRKKLGLRVARFKME